MEYYNNYQQGMLFVRCDSLIGSVFHSEGENPEHTYVDLFTKVKKMDDPALNYIEFCEYICCLPLVVSSLLLTLFSLALCCRQHSRGADPTCSS